MSRLLSESAPKTGATHARPLPLVLVLSVFLPFAAGYYLSYLYRSINAVIAPNLAADAGVGAADLGLLTSVYFLTFAALQLPLGLALDRFGPRRVAAALLLVAAAGAVVFAWADGLSGLVLGRALIGAGVTSSARWTAPWPTCAGSAPRTSTTTAPPGACRWCGSPCAPASGRSWRA